jgi:hypothetical protein
MKRSGRIRVLLQRLATGKRSESDRRALDRLERARGDHPATRASISTDALPSYRGFSYWWGQRRALQWPLNYVSTSGYET